MEQLAVVGTVVAVIAVVAGTGGSRRTERHLHSESTDPARSANPVIDAESLTESGLESYRNRWNRRDLMLAIGYDNGTWESDVLIRL